MEPSRSIDKFSAIASTSADTNSTYSFSYTTIEKPIISALTTAIEAMVLNDISERRLFKNVLFVILSENYQDISIAWYSVFSCEQGTDDRYSVQISVRI